MVSATLEKLLQDRRIVWGRELEKGKPDEGVQNSEFRIQSEVIQSAQRTQKGEEAGMGIRGGEVHEFVLVDDLPEGRWGAPVLVMAGVAGGIQNAQCGIKNGQPDGCTPNTGKGGGIVWAGRRCWGTFQMIERAMGQGALRRSVFLDPLTDEERFWAIGQALRCRGVAVVVADASGMNETVSRRMQLAAESGGVAGFFARPAWELDAGAGSWARGRWRVRPMGGETMRWEIEHVGGRGESARGAVWVAEWNYQDVHGGHDQRDGVRHEVVYGASAFRVFAGMGCGTDPAKMEKGRRTA